LSPNTRYRLLESAAELETENMPRNFRCIVQIHQDPEMKGTTSEFGEGDQRSKLISGHLSKAI
jgi:hypothetical protein